MSDGGRVINPSDARKITTSEGQSYGLFFALAATNMQGVRSLSPGRRTTLPGFRPFLPGCGGGTITNWAVLDSNSASDADIWIAWSLLEAGRLWKNPDYTDTARVVKRIAREEVVKVPGWVRCRCRVKWVLPKKTPRLIPATCRRSLRDFTRFGAPWTTLRETNLRLLLETAPKGFSPDWVNYQKERLAAVAGH
ncbi:glycosyl hydrolase family 8 [Shigella flexneri]